MVALNIVLMTAVVVGIVSLLAWAIVSDRRSRRAAGGELAPETAPLTHNLVMPRELRTHRSARSRPAYSRRAAERSTVS
jgi:hypothetical protein